MVDFAVVEACARAFMPLLEKAGVKCTISDLRDTGDGVAVKGADGYHKLGRVLETAARRTRDDPPP